MKQKINLIIYVILFIVGTLGVIAISHEGYHYFMIDGQPTGICFGKCDLGGSYDNTTKDTWSTAAITWNFTQEQFDKRDQLKEEKEAWIFSGIFTIILIGAFIYTGWD